MWQFASPSLLRALVLGGIAVFGFLGCSGGTEVQRQKEAVPSWFEQPDQIYSDQQYLTATAAGPSSQAAQNQAFGNLARIFEADIESRQQLLDDYREVRQQGDIESTEQTTRMVTQADIRSNQELLNAQVLEQQETGGTHYALVGMERQETLRIYSQQIESNRANLDEYRTRAQQTDNPVTRLALLRKALVLARVNERLVRQRNIVAGGAAADPASPITELEDAVRQAQVQCPVFVQADDVPSPIRSQVRSTLERRGFRLTDQAEEAVLDVRTSYEERPTLENRSDAHFLRWTLAIEVTDRTRNQALETFTTEERAGAPSESGAQRRAHNGARTAIQEDFSTFLDQILLNVNPS